MRRQASLSLSVAAVFAVLLLGLPLVNFYLPDLANTQILGFTATWLFLGVLFYPITVGLSFYFVKKSDQIEAECTDWRAVLADETTHPKGGA
jgi:inner membrane protein involved in colicin E2 resistance